MERPVVWIVGFTVCFCIEFSLGGAVNFEIADFTDGWDDGTAVGFEDDQDKGLDVACLAVGLNVRRAVFIADGVLDGFAKGRNEGLDDCFDVGIAVGRAVIFVECLPVGFVVN